MSEEKPEKWFRVAWQAEQKTKDRTDLGEVIIFFSLLSPSSFLVTTYHQRVPIQFTHLFQFSASPRRPEVLRVDHGNLHAAASTNDWDLESL